MNPAGIVSILGPFLLGVTVALVLGLLTHLLVGMRLNLFFISPDSPIEDQNLIPITTALKKASFFRSLRKGLWKERIEITLIDYQNRSFTYRIGYRLFRRFFIVLVKGDGKTSLNDIELQPFRKYSLRTGSILFVGDRQFNILVTPSLKTDENRPLPAY